ncbi:MAG TPA: hypothetical protein VH415_06015 [Nitrososphaeraceae archaeon]|jgi:hypothetical protein
MGHEKRKCEFQNCEKDSDVENLKINPFGGRDERHWYCFEHNAIAAKAKIRGLHLGTRSDKGGQS